jgi:hypothetical protein
MRRQRTYFTLAVAFSILVGIILPLAIGNAFWGHPILLLSRGKAKKFCFLQKQQVTKPF